MSDSEEGVRYRLGKALSNVRTSWYIYDTTTRDVAVVDSVERAEGMTKWEARQVLDHLRHKENS